MKKNSLLPFFLLLLSHLSYSQGWEYLMEIDGVRSETDELIPTTDGNYLLAGFQSGIVADSFGHFVTKITEDGQPLWRRILPNNPGGLYELAELTNNRYLSFSPYENFNSSYLGMLRLLDASGNTISEVDIVENSSGWISRTKIIPQSDGGFILAYIRNNAAEFFRFDTNLNSIAYSIPGITDGQLVDQLSNGNLIWWNNEAGSITIFETTISGLPVQQSTYPWTEDAEHLIYDNGKITFVAEESTNGTTSVLRLVRFDNTQNLISADTIWNGDYADALSMTPFTNGYLISGFTGPNPDPTGGFGWVVQTDLNGQVDYTYVANNRPGPSSFEKAIPSQVAGAIISGWYEGVVDPPTTSYTIKLDPNGVLFSNLVSGVVAIDNLSNCTPDSGETPAKDWLVMARKNGSLFASDLTDANGYYQMSLDTGTFSLILVAKSTYWEFCENNVPLTFATSNENATQDFLLFPDISCPDMSITVTSPWVQECETETIYVDYCNNGTGFGQDAYIEISLDSMLMPVSSSIPWSNISADNVVTFDLGDVAPFECGSFVLNVFLPCGAPGGASYGIQGHIFPDTICGSVDGAYSGALINSLGLCSNDSVGFVLRNVGVNAMTDQLGYFIVEDAVLITQGTIPLLQPQEDFLHTFPANGSTFTLIHEQVDKAPQMSAPIRVVEGCGTDAGGNHSMGFGNQFPAGDLDNFLDLDRTINLSTPQPNTLMTAPKGYDPEHFISPGATVEYMIPFQNLGSETVDRLVIKDSLSGPFDLVSLNALTSSHPYHVRMEGEGVMVFEFDDIQLPSASDDPLLSRGFLSFQITTDKEAAVGSVLTNNVSLKFDETEAIFPDQIFHTLGQDFVEVIIVKTDHPVLDNIQVSIAPNPVQDFAVFQIENHEADTYQLDIFDLRGSRVSSTTFANQQVTIQRGQLPAGLYIYHLTSDDGLVHTGRLICR